MRTHIRFMFVTLVLYVRLAAFSSVAAPFGYADPVYGSISFSSRAYPEYCLSDGRGGLLWSFDNVVLSHFNGANGIRVGGLVRTTTDGVLDTNFIVGPSLQWSFGTAVQADGQVLVGGFVVGDSSSHGTANYRVFRCSTNGVLDSAYHSPIFGGAPRFLTVQADGKLLAAWTDLSATTEVNGGIQALVRLNPDGSLDSGFQAPNLAGGFLGIFATQVVDTNGLIYIAGGFTSVNGQTRQGIARLLPNGTLDSSFVPSGFSYSTAIRSVLLQPAGKVLISGRLKLSSSSFTYYPIMRLNSDGSIDNSFNLVLSSTLNFYSARLMRATSDGKILAVSTSMARFNGDGTLDNTFTRLPFSGPLPGAEAYWFEQLADGRIVIPSDPRYGIGPTAVNGQPFDGSLRLQADGTLDPSFSSPAFQGDCFPTLAGQNTDGSLLIAGGFDHIGSYAKTNLVRINTNGVIDLSYNLDQPNVTAVLGLKAIPTNQAYALLQRGDLLAGLVTNALVRLKADGSTDPTFNPDLSGYIGQGYAFTDLLLDGAQPIVACGMSAQALINQSNPPVVRLFSTGSTDSSFQPNVPVPGSGTFFDGTPILDWSTATVDNIAQLNVGDLQVLNTTPDGKMIAAVGTTPDGTSYTYQIIRLNNDGSSDGSFANPTVSSGGSFYANPDVIAGGYGQVSAVFPIRCITGAIAQSNGAVVVCGSFTNVNGSAHSGIMRLKQDGTLDGSFPVGVGPTTLGGVEPVKISGISLDQAGRIWVSGNFVKWDGFNAPGYVRLNIDGTVDTSCLPQTSYYGWEQYDIPLFGGVVPGSAGDCFVFGSHLSSRSIWPVGLTRLVDYPLGQTPGTILWTLPQTNFVNGVGVSTSGTVFFNGAQGLTAVGTNGSVLWSSSIPNNPKGSLAVATNGTVYSQSGGLFAVDASGAVAWSLSNVSGGDNGPAIGSDGTIYCAAEDSNYVPYISALNPNGSVKWSTPIDTPAAFPVIGPDGTIYAVGGNYVDALTPNGTMKWTYYSATNHFDYVPSVGPDGVVYVSGDFFYAFDSTGHLKWQVQPGGFSYPVLGQDGTIYFAASPDIYVLNGNGTTNRIISLGNGLSLGQPAIGPDGSIYVDASAGNFPTTTDYLLCLAPSGVTNWQVPLDGSILNTPIIGPDNNIYFCTLNFAKGTSTLYAIEGNGGTSPSPWSSIRSDFRNSGQAPQINQPPPPPQPFRILYRFSGGTDGASPTGDLALFGNRLFGTTLYGGASGNGTVYALNTDGTGFTNLYWFSAGTGGPPPNNITNNDGAHPQGGVILAGTNLYGTAPNGGQPGWGTVFALNVAGGSFTNVHSFTGGSDGGSPLVSVISSGGKLYGAAGGNQGGTVFSVNPDGTDFTVLHPFVGAPNDGVAPQGELILSGEILYGTTPFGGTFNNGTVFAIKTDGTGYTNLYSFSSAADVSGHPPFGTNADGAVPTAGLVLAGNTLYGTAEGGGAGGNGTVFALNTDGKGFRTLHTFTPTTNSINSDGAQPSVQLILSGDTLYGTAGWGGISGAGTIFSINTNGTAFGTLYNFTGGDDGWGPASRLVLSGNTLYGTAITSGRGTVFALDITPNSIAITLTNGFNFGIVSNAFGFLISGTANLGFVVETSTNLLSPIWVPITTNTLSGGAVYFSDPYWTNYPGRFYRVRSL